MLAAAERDIGGCMVSAIKRLRLRRYLGLADRYTILLVLALGVPAEAVAIETVGPDGDVKYFRDAADTHHVPKRALDDVILER